MISKFSTLHKAERDYSSISQFLSHMKYLGLSASAEEFKTELKKYRNGILMSYAHLLEANNDENNEIPFYSYIFYGQDSEKKWDWILSLVPAERVQYWLEDKNPTLPSETFHQFVSEHPDMKEVFEKHGFVFTELGGGGLKTDTFEWNGFSILNAGFKYRNMERILQELQPTVERIKKHGFGNILYNPIVFVSRPMQGQVYNTFQQQYQKQPTGAYYSVSKDHVVIKATDWDKAMKYNAAFAHELAHRHYYKFLTPTQRQRWEHHFNNRQVDVSAQDIAQLTRIIQSCAPTIYDSLRNEEFPDFSRFDYRKFTDKLRKNLEIKEVLDFIVERYARLENKQGKNIKTLRREYLQTIFNPEEFYGIAWFGKVLPLGIEVLETQKLQQKAISVSRYTTPSKYIENKYRLSELSGEELEIAKAFARIESLYEEGVGLLRNWSSGWEHFIGMTIKLPYSSSEYGLNNPSEDYAEAFEHFIHNKEMPVDIYREFVNLHNIRLGNKTAKLSPKEEMQIDALQKRIDNLYRKKDYEEAENLEEKLEALLNDLEAREEHFNIESDESEDFYGWKNRLTETGLVPDMDDENSNPSLEEELGRLYYEWIKDDGRFEDTTARKDWQNAHPGSTWKDVPQELQKSEKVFVILFWSIIADTYPSHWDDKPRKMEDITFEEALAAAKDAYETVTKRRDRTRKLLKKADFQRDKYYQQLAESAYNKVKEALRKESDGQEEAFLQYIDSANPDADYEYTPVMFTRDLSLQGFRIRAADLGITENQFPLLLAFGTKEKVKTPALGVLRGKETMVLLFNNIRYPNSFQFSDTRLDKQTFIHEYIHYLDAGRGIKESKYTFKGSPEEKDLQEYYNNPKEMNAYYQENISSLYAIVNKMIELNYEPFLEAMSSGYEAFFKFAIKTFNDRWWQYLTPENKRRVQKRLYSVFEDMKEKYTKK